MDFLPSPVWAAGQEVNRNHHNETKKMQLALNRSYNLPLSYQMKISVAFRSTFSCRDLVVITDQGLVHFYKGQLCLGTGKQYETYPPKKMKRGNSNS